MAKLLSGTRIYGTATVDTQLFVSGTSVSTSTTTGALQVVGGIGVGSGMYVGGVITATSIVSSTSTTTGALQVIGGVGIGGNLWVGGTIYGAHTGVSTTATNLSGSLPGSIPIQSANGVTAYIATGTTGYVLTWSGSTATWSAVSGLSAGSATTATNIAGGNTGQVPYQTGPGLTSFVSTGTAGTVLVSNGTSAPTFNNTLTLTSTLASTSTNTGALQVWGGVGIAGSVNIGSGNNSVNTSTWEKWKLVTVGSTSTARQGSDGNGLNFTSNALWTGSAWQEDYTNQKKFAYIQHLGNGRHEFRTAATGSGISWIVGLTLDDNAGTFNVPVTITATTASVSTATGALIVNGGVGIGGDLFLSGNKYQVGSTYSTLATTYNLINTTATTVNFAGSATILNMGASNSGTTNIRNSLVISGNLTVQGSTTIVDSTVTNIADPILTLGGLANNAAPTADDNKDRGIAFKYVNPVGSTSTGFFGFKDSTGYFTYIATATITNEVVSGTKSALDVNLAGGSAQALVYQSAQDTTTFLAAGTSGYILQTNGTGSAPSWVAPSGVSVGTASYADQVRTLASTASSNYYLTFVDSNNATNSYESVYTTSSLVINPGTGNVGVGGASSTAKLHVQGTGAVPSPNATVNSNGLLRLRTSDAVYVDIGAYNVSPWTTWMQSGDTGSAAYYALVINPLGGNVGVGTTSTSAKLHVVGTESRFGGVASGYISVYNASTRSGYIQANAGTDLRVASDTDPMTFYVNGSERARIDTWGNALIGKVTPYNTTTDVLTVLRAQSATTQVFVDNQSTNTSAAAAISLSAYGGGTSLSVPSSYPVTGLNPFVITVNSTERLRITSNGGIAFNGSTNYGSSGQILQSNGDAAPTWVPVSGTTVGTSTQVQTVLRTTNATHYPTFVDSNNASATAESVYTTSSFTINAMTGNVGIAAAPSSTATYRLNVANIIQVGAQGGADVTLIGGGAGTGSFIRGYYGTDGTQAFNIIGNGASYVQAGSGGGTFSIGTSTVSSNGLLQVNGGIGIAPNSTVRQTTNADGGTLKFYGTQFVAAQTNSGSYGYVGGAGIASVSPSASYVTLDVGGQGVGTSHRLKVVNDGTGITGYLYYGQEGGSTATLYASVATGYVGIGTTNPRAPLDITKNGYNATGNWYEISRLVDASANKGLSLGYDNTAQLGLILGHSSSAQSGIAFWSWNGTAWGERMRIETISQTVPNLLVGQTSYVNSGVSGTTAVATPALVLGGQASGGDNQYMRRWGAGVYQTQTYNGGNSGHYQLQPYGGNVMVSGNGNTSTNKFEVQGTAGQLFSVSDSFTGTIFAASDVSGIPSIEVIDTGLVKLAQYNGQVTISTGTIQSSMGLTVNTATYITTLGVGTVASGTLGEIRASNEITAYYSSDARLKENISVISNPIEIVKQLRGVHFDWTEEHIASRGGEDGYFVRKHDIGVIAQEVEAVLPEVVATRNDGFKAVKYEKLVALLIEAVKEQQKDIDNLRSELEQIKSKF